MVEPLWKTILAVCAESENTLSHVPASPLLVCMYLVEMYTFAKIHVQECLCSALHDNPNKGLSNPQQQ